MDERTYRLLKYIALVMGMAFVGLLFYEHLASSKQPGDYAYHAASNYFADGHYEQALSEYQVALKENPDHIPAMRGRAETLTMLERERQAIDIYHKLIALQPETAGNYAALGIAYDRIGKHEKALANYEKALSLDVEVGDGPHWLDSLM